MKQVKKLSTLLWANLLILLLSNCTTGQNEQATIKWDEWNVPHIIAPNETEAFYALGWAQIKMHGDKILRLYGQARGEAASYWGGSFLESDKQKLRLNIPQRAADWYEAQTDEMKGYLKAFAQGMNDYIDTHADEFADDVKLVLPVRYTDPLANLQVVYHLGVAGFALNPQAGAWKNAGSNAWAIGPSRSESGKAMLLMQPHPPWVMDNYLFFESHVITPDNNRYGISALGAPAMAMGFNEYLGWGLTFNQADAMDLYDLSTKGSQYQYDGTWKDFETVEHIIKVKEEAGLRYDTLVAKKSVHGWVMAEKEGKALALRLGGLDKPFFVQQFHDMAHAQNLQQFEKALAGINLPLQNVVYADRHGDIFYLYNGEIPQRNTNNYGQWQQIQDGANKQNLVTEYVPYEGLPKFSNPTSGFISNTNNPPWSSTYPAAIKSEDYPGFIAPDFMDFRTQGALRMLNEKSKVSFEELEAMVFSTDSDLARLTVDQLIDFAKHEGSAEMEKVASVLNTWDRAFNPDSKGAVLFASWVFGFKGQMFEQGGNKLFAEKKLTREAQAYLKAAAGQTIGRYGAIDVAWGEVYKMSFGGTSVPSSLGTNETGSFAAGGYRPMSASEWTIVTGPSFSAIVEFGDEVKAKGLLSYGNASQQAYAQSGKQLNMLSNRQLRNIAFSQREVDAASVKEENPGNEN